MKNRVGLIWGLSLTLAVSAASAAGAGVTGLSAKVTEVCPGNRASCCPTGYTNDVLTSSVFKTAAPNQCIVAGSSINTIAAQGGSSIVIGGPNTDIIQAANGNNFVVPGAGQDVVSTGTGDDTVAIYDVCEATWGKTIDMGTGFNTLISPVPLAQLRAMGMTIANVSQVIVQQNSCKSACVTQPDCSGHGSCIEGTQAGKVACQCAPGYTGSKCEVPPVAPTTLSPANQPTLTACYAPSFTGTLQSSGTAYSDLHYATPDFSHGVCAPLFCDAAGNSVGSPTDAQLNTPPAAGSTCSAFGDANCPADPKSLTNVCTTNANCAAGSVCASHCVDAGCTNIEHRCAKLASTCGGLPAQDNCDEFQICPQPGYTGQPNRAALQSELGQTTAPGPTGTIDPTKQDPLPTSYDKVADLVCNIGPDPLPIDPPLADSSNKPANDGSKQWGIFVTPTSDFSIAPTKRSDGIGELNMTAEGGVSAGAIMFGDKVSVIDANIQALLGDCGITLVGKLKVFGEAIAVWTPSAAQSLHLVTDSNNQVTTPAGQANACKGARDQAKAAISEARQSNLYARAVQQYYSEMGLTQELCEQIQTGVPGGVTDSNGNKFDCDNLGTLSPVNQLSIINAWKNEYDGKVASYQDFSKTLGTAQQTIQASGTITAFSSPHPYNLEVLDQPIPIGPITVTVAVEGFGSWDIEGGIQFGLGFSGDFSGAGNIVTNALKGQSPSLGDIRAYGGPVITPALQTGVTAFVGVGIPGVSVGLQGSIDLLDISLPTGIVAAAVRVRTPDTRRLAGSDFAGTPAAGLEPTDYRWVTGYQWNSNLTLSELKGELDVALRIHVLFFHHTFKEKLFGWPGLTQNFTLISGSSSPTLNYANDYGTQADTVAYTPIAAITDAVPKVVDHGARFPDCGVVVK